MSFIIEYHKSVVENDIPKFSGEIRKKIKKDIEKKLMTRPEVFGKPLRKSLKGYRKLRSGDYRIVFRIEKNTVKIILIGHRSVVYKKGIDRLKNKVN